jgi:hypothetical protein
MVASPPWAIRLGRTTRWVRHEGVDDEHKGADALDAR